MSRSDWDDELKAFRWIGSALVIAVVATIAIDGFPAIDRECQNAQTDYYRAYERITAEPDVPTQKQNYPADKHDHADVCAQQRMAKAAELGLWLLAFTLAATGFAAVASGLSLRQMQTSSERQLRAYVNIGTAEIRFLSKALATSYYRVEIVMKNFGATPAYHVFSTISIDTGDMAVRLMDQGSANHSHGVVGPSAEALITAEIALMTTDTQMLTYELPCIFIDGIVLYEDAFGNKRTTQLTLTNGPTIYEGPLSPDQTTGLLVRQTLGYKLQTRGQSRAT